LYCRCVWKIGFGSARYLDESLNDGFAEGHVVQVVAEEVQFHTEDGIGLCRRGSEDDIAGVHPVQIHFEYLWPHFGKSKSFLASLSPVSGKHALQELGRRGGEDILVGRELLLFLSGTDDHSLGEIEFA
jgi:hypothetical protein